MYPPSNTSRNHPSKKGTSGPVKNNTVKAKREKGHKEKGQFFYLEKVLDLIRCVEAWVNGQNSLEHIYVNIYLLLTVKFKAMVEVQEGSFESPAIRETLLDVVLDRLAKSGKNAIFTRIIYVARFVKRENSADVVEGLSLLHLCFGSSTDTYCTVSGSPFACMMVSAFQRKLIEKNDHQNEVTGMLVVYPTCMLHLLEVRGVLYLPCMRTVGIYGCGALSFQKTARSHGFKIHHCLAKYHHPLIRPKRAH